MDDLKEILEKATNYHWEMVESSNIIGYTYDRFNNTLYIAFKKNKSGYIPIYGYSNVPMSDVKSLHQSDSKGKWVNDHLVKPHREFTKYELELIK